MKNLFNKTYFKFLFGFLVIIAISVLILLVAGFLGSDETLENDVISAEIIE